MKRREERCQLAGVKWGKKVHEETGIAGAWREGRKGANYQALEQN